MRVSFLTKDTFDLYQHYYFDLYQHYLNIAMPENSNTYKKFLSCFRSNDERLPTQQFEILLI